MVNKIMFFRRSGQYVTMKFPENIHIQVYFIVRNANKIAFPCIYNCQFSGGHSERKSITNHRVTVDLAIALGIECVIPHCWPFQCIVELLYGISHMKRSSDCVVICNSFMVSCLCVEIAKIVVWLVQ